MAAKNLGPNDRSPRRANIGKGGVCKKLAMLAMLAILTAKMAVPPDN
jgi:hypothetical protein